MNEETNELKDKLESTIVTRTFNVSGMPLKAWEEVNKYCKEAFGDNRWTMIYTLMKNAKEDYKFNLIYDEIQEIKYELENIKNKEVKVETRKVPMTFGMKGDDKNG
ncbi:hypothetical protein [uncultured Arcobacter sp.]|uniref:hypothetical protein n=1 Tax=uncultured Arcobacter sp. TaxID=165434 RepID=UPI0026191866|nr:hypothetical protein [uncultured Arcobacter sp.]